MQIDSRRIERRRPLRRRRRAAPTSSQHALARGAAAALVPDDAHAALATSRAPCATDRSARVVAITGATGKTTTKDILATLCARHAAHDRAEGNYNNELGVPLTLCRLEPDTEICITEMGMRGLGQIAWLAAFTRPDIGVITNVGPCTSSFSRPSRTSRARRPS